jgi:SAM-dependent methyltransferase
MNVRFIGLQATALFARSLNGWFGADGETMHQSSFLKVKAFVDIYGRSLPAGARVIEIGSQAYAGQDTYRPLFPAPAYEYVGLDLEPGPNVDLVAKGYAWSNLASSSFDFAVSGQTFEHNPFFWVTFCEMARIVKPGGYVMVIAPGAGHVHRFPYDCWRFYPDAWTALCTLTGLVPVETYFERDAMVGLVDGGFWRDSAVIARKPDMDALKQKAFDDRLTSLVSPYASMPAATAGPCFRAYEEAVRILAAKASAGRKAWRLWDRLVRRPQVWAG